VFRTVSFRVSTISPNGRTDIAVHARARVNSLRYEDRTSRARSTILDAEENVGGGGEVRLGGEKRHVIVTPHTR